jgi:uncharacterized membrane protein HdeD (DUF308 family)
MQTLFRKWWVILIQGVLLILLSTYVFSHPGIALAGIALWLSILVLISGLAGLLGWWLTNADSRETSSLLWSIGCIVLGLVLLTKTDFHLTTAFNNHWHLDDRNRCVADAAGMDATKQ